VAGAELAAGAGTQEAAAKVHKRVTMKAKARCSGSWCACHHQVPDFAGSSAVQLQQT